MSKICDAPRKNGLLCPKDKIELIRDYGIAPTYQVKEVLDNGLMPKPLERFTDAEKLFDDNSKTPKE